MKWPVKRVKFFVSWINERAREIGGISAMEDKSLLTISYSVTYPRFFEGKYS
jgi:hypothetical protein